MRYRRPTYYGRFRCLGGACPDTCCRDWEIVLDEAALEDYRKAPAGLREQLAAGLRRGEDGEVCFRLGQDGRCSMLTPDGLCRIQRDWGEAHLCGHCRQYPRFEEQFGSLSEYALAISCPEAARLLMQGGPFALEEWAQGEEQPPFDGVDPELLAGLERTRARALDVLGREGASVWQRLGQVLALARLGQEAVDRGEYRLLAQLEAPPPVEEPQELCALGVRLLEALSRLEPLRAQWPEKLRRAAGRLGGMDEGALAQARAGFHRADPDWEQGWRNLAAYFLYRHWLKTVNDDLLFGRAALAAGGCLAVYLLALWEWMEDGPAAPERTLALCSDFSREVEHLEENLEGLIQAFDEQGLWPFLPVFRPGEGPG